MIEITEGFHRPQEIDEMPDLASLDNKLRLNLLLNALAFKAGPANIKARALWMHFIRNVDQLIRGYNEARASLQETTQEPDSVIGPLFRAATQMEVCLTSLRRATRFARRLRIQRDCPGCNVLSVTSDDVLERLVKITKTLRDLEERILNRDIDENDMLMLGFTQTGIRVEQEEASFKEISGWIEELYQLAIEMTDTKDLES